MKNKPIYEISFAALAIVAVTIAFADILDKIPSEYYSIAVIIDRIILIIFAVDYFVRLYKSKDKKAFIKSNIFDLLAIIPFDSFFRAFRLFRLIRIIRLAVFFKRFENRSMPFLKTNGFIYILYLTIFIMLAGSVAIYYFEKGITMDSFSDAIWWSFVTTTTVGYGDISPATTAGRITAATLMIVGIGFIGMLTGTIATFFIKKTKSPEVKNENQLLDLSDLDNDKFTIIKEFSEYIKNKKD